MRLAALDQIGELNDVATGPSLWPLLNDSDFAIRRQACLVFPVSMQRELQAAVADDDPVLAESATFILVNKMGETRLATTLNEIVSTLVDDMVTLHEHSEATSRYSSAAGRLFSHALADQIHEYTERVFWLLGPLCGHAEAESIRRLLTSDNQMTQANAAEALESITSPAISRKLVRLCSPPSRSDDQEETRRPHAASGGGRDRGRGDTLRLA